MDVSFGFNEFIKKVEKIMLIKFASSRKKYCHDSTEEWIKQRIGNYETIFIDEKSKIAFDYLIDDYHVECIKAAVKGGIVFMIDRPWNNSADIREKIKHIANIKIADSFKEIENYLIQ